eukprot:c24848_g1_i1 orf=596-2230(-)
MLGLQFLYPSEEETHKLLRFLLDKISKSSGDASGGRKGRGNRFASERISNSKTFTAAQGALFHWLEEAKQNTSSETSGGVQKEDHVDLSAPIAVPFRTCPLRLASTNSAPGKKTPALITLQAKPKSFLIPSVLELNTKNALMSATLLDGQLSHLSQEVRSVATEDTADVRVLEKGFLQDSDSSSHLGVESSSLSRGAIFSKEKYMMGEGEEKAQEKESTSYSLDEHTDFKQRELSMLEERLRTISSENSKLTREAMEFNQSINKLEVEYEASSKHLEGLKKKHELINMAAEIALDSTQTEESKILRLKVCKEESQKRLADSKTQWESIFTELKSKKEFLESAAFTKNKELHTKLQELKNVRQQIKDTTIKLKQREEQINILTGEMEKGIKGPSRSTYVRRITELIKNSKKQDIDISRIIGETRDLQRESNTNQGRLKRIHVLVDELVFRDAKKDPVCRQAYRLLTSMHEDFSDCYDKVFAMDKVRREITELQVAVEIMEKRPVDVKKVQADFDALVAENLSLEKSLQAMQQNDSVQDTQAVVDE